MTSPPAGVRFRSSWASRRAAAAAGGSPSPATLNRAPRGGRSAAPARRVGAASPARRGEIAPPGHDEPDAEEGKERAAVARVARDELGERPPEVVVSGSFL